MKYASDFRGIARDALRGNWGVAILTGFVASLIGATIISGGGGSISNSNSSDSSTNNLISPEILEKILPVLLAVSAILILWCLVTFIIGGAGKLGYAKFNLNLIDRKPAAFSDLFSQFNRIGDGFCMNILIAIYTFLWTLLFIIPGIIKSYSYSMTPYILAENPEITANQAITISKDMMRGNKWRLFCLEFSFIGWELLGLIPMSVSLPLLFLGTTGSILWFVIALSFAVVLRLFLRPYQETAHAAFYREVSCNNIQFINPLTEENKYTDNQ